MHYFANLHELRHHLSSVASEKDCQLCAHMETWLAHPRIGETYLFEKDDDPEWVENVCGRLGLHAILPVKEALDCLSEQVPEEDLVYQLKSYVMLYWLA